MQREHKRHSIKVNMGELNECELLKDYCLFLKIETNVTSDNIATIFVLNLQSLAKQINNNGHDSNVTGFIKRLSRLDVKGISLITL